MTTECTPSLLARHQQHWQRKVRRCAGKVKEAARAWQEAQSSGLQSANALANDVVLFRALAESKGEIFERVDGLRSASLAKLKRRAQDHEAMTQASFDALAQSLDLIQEGERALLVSGVVALHARSGRLATEGREEESQTP